MRSMGGLVCHILDKSKTDALSLGPREEGGE